MAEQTKGDMDAAVVFDHTNLTAAGLAAAAKKVSTEPQLIPRETYDELWDLWWLLAALLFFGTVELYFRRSWSLL